MTEEAGASASKVGLPAIIIPARHSYSTEAIRLSLDMFLIAAVSLRACSAIVQLIFRHVPLFRAIPAPNTVQSWLLRIGLYELTRPKERADDWVFILDHTIQLGVMKCLVILGIRLAHWRELQRPLELQDMTVITLDPVEQSDGRIVYQQVEAASKIVGVPVAVLNDQGSELRVAGRLFQEHHPETQVLSDICHRTALALKRVLEDDSRWASFVKQCGQSQPKVKQTELGYLAPPTLKVKGRYMNLGPLVSWGTQMLRLVDTPVADRLGKGPLERLDEKFGWIKEYREALAEWEELHVIKDSVLDHLRIHGYHSKAAEVLRTNLAPHKKYPASQAMTNELLTFVEEQCQSLAPGQSLPASSEVIESLIGKGKRIQGQHSRGGFTKMILGMAASVVYLTSDRAQRALERVTHQDLKNWCRAKFGDTLAKLRRRALGNGTKVGSTATNC